MKTFREFLGESVSADAKKKIISHAQDQYRGVAADLPSHGNHHYDSAHDHIADHLHDTFHKEHPGANFRKLAKEALKNYVSDDRSESRKRDRAADRAYAARNAPPKIRKVREKKPAPVKPWDSRRPVRKGVGSH